MQVSPTPERAGAAERKGLALLGPRSSDPGRRSGFQEALRQMQARQARDEAGEKLPGLEERPEARAGSRPAEGRETTEQRRDGQAAARSRKTGESQEARPQDGAEGTTRESQEARPQDGAEETTREAAAWRAGQAGRAGDEEAAEAAKAAGATQASGVRLPQAVTAEGEVPEAAAGEGSAWARFLERAGAQSRQPGGEETMEYGSNPEQLQAQPAQAEPETLLSPFDLLAVHEVMDPDLQVDPMPNQLLDRLQQAMQTTPNPAVLEEAGEVVVPQVVRGLVAMVRDGVSEIRIQLQPADLGEIELRVRAMEGVIRGEITVQNQEIRHLLVSQLNRLRTALADQGLDLQDFEVGVAHDGRFSQPESGGREAFGDGGSAPWRSGRQSGGESAAAPLPRAEAVDLGDHAVDYVI